MVMPVFNSTDLPADFVVRDRKPVDKTLGVTGQSSLVV